MSVQKIKNNVIFGNDITVVGNTIVSGTVDGRDVATDGTNQDNHIADVANPHAVTKAQVGLSEVANTKNNTAASVAPAVTDDTAGGYSVGSYWVDTTGDLAYVCVDATNGAAIWKDVTAGAESGDVVGPGSSTDNAIARYDLATGKLLQDSGVTISDTGVISGALDVVSTGQLQSGAGTAGAPTYSFSTDVDTGLYLAGGSLVAGVGGTGVLEVTGTNRVQIASGVSNYETLVDADDVLTNKKYVDDKQWDTSDVVSGTFADARISQSSVTQHEAAITIGNLIGAPTGDVIGTSDIQTLTNKSLVDLSTFIVDQTDATKKLQFDAASITTATTRTLTAPDASDTIAVLDTQQSFSNKEFDDATVLFVDTGDDSKKMKFDVSGVTTATTRTLTVPNVSDTIVTLAATQTLTNKFASSATNTIGANEIRTTGASVVVDTAAPPTNGTFMLASSATAASWGNKSAITDGQEVTATTLTSTTSTSYIDLPGMSITTSNTQSMKYIVTVSLECKISSANKIASLILNVNGSDVTDSERSFKIPKSNAEFLMSTQAITGLLGNGIVIKVRIKTSGSTLKVYNRSLLVYG
jgi:hypothetical protein